MGSLTIMNRIKRGEQKMEKHYPAARALFEITPEIEHLAELCEKNTAIDKELYTKYEVKRGLRDLNGKGVLAGLTSPARASSTTAATISKTL